MFPTMGCRADEIEHPQHVVGSPLDMRTIIVDLAQAHADMSVPCMPGYVESLGCDRFGEDFER